VSVDSKGEVDVTTALVLSLVETEPRSGQAGAEEKYRPPRVGSEFRERLRPAVSFLVVLTFLVLAIVFVLAHGSVADPDIWWHLHNADYLVHHHALPRYDMYSFTVAGHPWINHEWLGELPYYFGWRALGLRGIDAVTLSVLSLIFLGLLYLSYRHSGHYKASVAACCYAVFLASVSFGPRTILFGYAYLVGLLVVLQRFPERQQLGVDNSSPFLPVGEHSRFLAYWFDSVFDRHRDGIGPWNLGCGFGGAMDTFAAQEAVAGLGHECGRAVRESIWFAAGVLSLRPRIPAETQH